MIDYGKALRPYPDWIDPANAKPLRDFISGNLLAGLPEFSIGHNALTKRTKYLAEAMIADCLKLLDLAIARLDQKKVVDWNCWGKPAMDLFFCNTQGPDFLSQRLPLHAKDQLDSIDALRQPVPTLPKLCVTRPCTLFRHPPAQLGQRAARPGGIRRRLGQRAALLGRLPETTPLQRREVLGARSLRTIVMRIAELQ